MRVTMTDDAYAVLRLIGDSEPIRLPPLLDTSARELQELGLTLSTVGGWFVTSEGRTALARNTSRSQLQILNQLSNDLRKLN